MKMLVTMKVTIIITIGVIISGCSLSGTYERAHNDGYIESPNSELKISAGSLFPYYHIEIKSNGTFLYYKPDQSDSPIEVTKDGKPYYNLGYGKWEKHKDTLTLHLNGEHKYLIYTDSLVPLNSLFSNWIKK